MIDSRCGICEKDFLTINMLQLCDKCRSELVFQHQLSIEDGVPDKSNELLVKVKMLLDALDAAERYEQGPRPVPAIDALAHTTWIVKKYELQVEACKARNELHKALTQFEKEKK